MRVLMDAAEIERDRPKWKRLRRRGITGTDIASIMRVPGAWSNPHAVYWAKVAGDEIPDAGRMAMGRWLEPYVAAEFTKMFPGLPLTAGPLGCHGRRRWQMCTFDLLTDDATVQIKTVPSWRGRYEWQCWGDPPYGDVPPAYLAQCYWEADVASAAQAYLAAAHRGTGEVRVYRLPVDAGAQSDLALMRAEAELFRKRVDALDEPEPDWMPASRDALVRVYSDVIPQKVLMPARLRDQLRTRKRRLVAAQRAFDQAANQVRARLRSGTHAAGPDGEVFAHRSVYTPRRLSAAQVRLLHPDVADECTVAGRPVDKLLVEGYDDDD